MLITEKFDTRLEPCFFTHERRHGLAGLDNLGIQTIKIIFNLFYFIAKHLSRKLPISKII